MLERQYRILQTLLHVLIFALQVGLLVLTGLLTYKLIMPCKNEPFPLFLHQIKDQTSTVEECDVLANLQLLNIVAQIELCCPKDDSPTPRHIPWKAEIRGMYRIWIWAYLSIRTRAGPAGLIVCV